MLAVAYDVMIPGCHTRNTNNLRLWESKPKRGFDLNSFNGMLLDIGMSSNTNEDMLFSWKLRGRSRIFKQCCSHHLRLVSQRSYYMYALLEA